MDAVEDLDELSSDDEDNDGRKKSRKLQDPRLEDISRKLSKVYKIRASVRNKRVCVKSKGRREKEWQTVWLNITNFWDVRK